MKRAAIAWAIAVWVVFSPGAAGEPTLRLARLEEVRDQLMRALAADRIEVAVFDRLSGDATLKRLGLEGTIHPLAPPLQKTEVFHFLHRRHAAPAPPVERVIRAMGASRELKSLRRAAVRTSPPRQL